MVQDTDESVGVMLRKLACEIKASTVLSNMFTDVEVHLETLRMHLVTPLQSQVTLYFVEMDREFVPMVFDYLIANLQYMAVKCEHADGFNRARLNEAIDVMFDEGGSLSTVLDEVNIVVTLGRFRRKKTAGV